MMNGSIRGNKSMSINDEWINKTWLHRMEYYSAIKKNGVLIHTTTGKTPENIMLNKKASHK
jgi:hypothetical protein